MLRRKPIRDGSGTPQQYLEQVGWVFDDNGCAIWKGSKFSNGYGQLKIGGQPRGAHRVSYEVYKGAIPDGFVVRHTCDNKPCINPEHLILGTVYDNVQDRQVRNRTAKGENSGAAKLTNEQARDVRSEVDEVRRKSNRFAVGNKYRELAEKYSVDYSTIQNICLRISYKDA